MNHHQQIVQNNAKRIFPEHYQISKTLQHIQQTAIETLDQIAQKPWAEQQILDNLATKAATKTEYHMVCILMGYSYRQIAQIAGVTTGAVGMSVTATKNKVANEPTGRISLQYENSPAINQAATFTIEKQKDSQGAFFTIKTPVGTELTSRDCADYEVLDALFNGRDNWVQLVQQWNLEADNDSELAASIYA